MLTLLFPLLRWAGAGFTFKEFIITGYGGLRGALALSLALIVHVDTDNFTARSRDLVKFHTIGCVVLTLLLNGTTTAWMMRKAKIIENT